MRVLVTGATGKVGSAVTQHLANSGIPTTAASRSAVTAQAHLGLGDTIQYMDLDFHQPAGFARALEGKSHVFLVAPPNLQEADLLIQFIHQAQAHKVEHITLLSGRTTGDLKGRTLNKLEQSLKEGSQPYTILRAGWFMQNFNTWHKQDIKQEDRIYVPAGNSKTAFVDVRDLAVAVERTFTQPGHRFTQYELVGKQALDHYEVADILGTTVGRPIQYVDMSAPDFIERELMQGASAQDAAFNVFLYDIVKTGKEAEISEDLPKVLGRPAISFEEYAQDHRQAWLPE